MDRRSFLVGGAAAVCLGCSGNDDDRQARDRDDAPPADRGGFGAPIDLGTEAEVIDAINAGGGVHYVVEARTYLVRYPADALEAAREVYDEVTLDGLEHGLLALFQRCTHLHCRVTHCAQSKQFECACHGATFNSVGERVGGPAPRGLDRFPLRFEGDRVVVDTAASIPGLPDRVRTVEDPPAGPHCT